MVEDDLSFLDTFSDPDSVGLDFAPLLKAFQRVRTLRQEREGRELVANAQAALKLGNQQLIDQTMLALTSKDMAHSVKEAVRKGNADPEDPLIKEAMIRAIHLDLLTIQERNEAQDAYYTHDHVIKKVLEKVRKGANPDFKVIAQAIKTGLQKGFFTQDDVDRAKQASDKRMFNAQIALLYEIKKAHENDPELTPAAMDYIIEKAKRDGILPSLYLRPEAQRYHERRKKAMQRLHAVEAGRIDHDAPGTKLEADLRDKVITPEELEKAKLASLSKLHRRPSESKPTKKLIR